MKKGSFPRFGVPQQERAPRTGLGANYSETAQRLMKQESTWREKKFYVLGAIVALLFIGAVFYLGGMKKVAPVEIPLQVNSKPVGAEIWVDGQKSGITPMKFAQKRDMTLTFRLDGYQEQVFTVREDAWPTEINATLDPIPERKIDSTSTSSTSKETGRLIQIESTPPGATVVMDGQEAGVTPAQIALPDDNPHQLDLQLPGYQPISQTIDAETGETLSFQLQVEEQKGTLSYAGQYPVTIFSQGKAVRGNTLQLPPGTYKLTFKTKKGAYINFTRTVEIKAGDTKIVSAPPMGSLNVKANPSNCKISINGEVVDDAPIFNLPVQAGNHRIRFNWVKMGKTLDRTVVIPQSETVTVTGVPD
jgi:hypothetical protein